WTGAKRLSKQPMAGKVDHENQRVTYMSNGIRSYEEDSDDVADTRNHGGIPLRNPRLTDKDPASVNFTCYTQIGEEIFDESPITCMERFTRSHNGDRVDDPNHFVAMMIENDGEYVKFTAVMPTFGTGFTYADRTVRIDRRVQPLIPIFSIFPSGTDYPLASEITLELHYFVYTPATGLGFFKIHEAREALRKQGLVRVNTTGIDLGAPPPKPWRARLEGPVPGDPEQREFIVFPTMRESNKYFVEWKIRDTCVGTDSGWFRRGLHLNVANDDPDCDRIEVEVRVDEGYANDDPPFTPVECLAYTYSSDEVGECN
ncbi:MAG: hypothetical protein PVF33_13855, partial [Candidatus Latescibacterota bacterium]